MSADAWRRDAAWLADVARKQGLVGPVDDEARARYEQRLEQVGTRGLDPEAYLCGMYEALRFAVLGSSPEHDPTDMRSDLVAQRTFGLLWEVAAIATDLYPPEDPSG